MWTLRKHGLKRTIPKAQRMRFWSETALTAGSISAALGSFRHRGRMRMRTGWPVFTKLTIMLCIVSAARHVFGKIAALLGRKESGEPVAIEFPGEAEFLGE